MKYLFLSWLLATALLAPVVPASAASDGLPSLISFSTGGDSAGSRDTYFDLDYAFVDDTRLLFSSASNRSDNQDGAITTRSVLLGFRTDPLARVSAGVDLERWGEKGSLETDTFRAVLDIALQDWQFSLRPQWRTLTFTTDCVAIIAARCQPEVNVKSSGMALDLSYYSDGPWSFSLGFARHQYDQAVQALALDPRLQFVFSAATLDLSMGLEKRRGSVGVFYSSGRSLLGFTHLRSESAVTAETSIVNTLRYSTDLTEQWRLRLRVGAQMAEDGSDCVSFAGAGLAYSW